MSKIILHCITEGKKLRIKFHSYIDGETKEIYYNSYNNTYNCQFPKDIRVEGRFYEIPQSDLSIISGDGKTPFYKIKKGNITILTQDPLQNTTSTIPAKIFVIAECVCCLTNDTNIVFCPCGHQCVCSTCNPNIKNKCPICRVTIKTSIFI